MKRVKMLTMVFTFWVLLIALSASWLLFLLINNIQMIYENFLLVIILVIACLSFFLSVFFIYQIIVDVLIEIKKAREKEKNIKDILQYEQVVDPPSIYT
jgi:hypothetical protein